MASPSAAAFASAIFLTLCACESDTHVKTAQVTHQPPARTRMSATVPHAGNLDRAVYRGRWEVVSNRTDGRYQGSSARSFHDGDTITVVFVGRRMRIFGVTGKNGGNALIVMAGKPVTDAYFTSAKKETHQLVYDSGLLADRVHSASVVVTNPPMGRGYVNVDEIEIDR